MRSKGFFFYRDRPSRKRGLLLQINTCLKDVIALISKHYDYVVIDGEAGIEQINRRVMEKVTHLLLVTDQSKKGRDVVSTIAKVATELVMYDQIGVVQNRMSEEALAQKPTIDNLETLAYVPCDAALAQMDAKGENVFSLPSDTPVCLGAKRVLEEIHIL